MDYLNRDTLLQLVTYLKQTGPLLLTTLHSPATTVSMAAKEVYTASFAFFESLWEVCFMDSEHIEDWPEPVIGWHHSRLCEFGIRPPLDHRSYRQRPK